MSAGHYFKADPKNDTSRPFLGHAKDVTLALETSSVLFSVVSLLWCLFLMSPVISKYLSVKNDMRIKYELSSKSLAPDITEV